MYYPAKISPATTQFAHAPNVTPIFEVPHKKPEQEEEAIYTNIYSLFSSGFILFRRGSLRGREENRLVYEEDEINVPLTLSVFRDKTGSYVSVTVSSVSLAPQSLPV